jgi:Trk K+ transport system NAD-binding subunit
VCAIVRDHVAFIPERGETFKLGDRIYAAVAAASMDKFRAFLGRTEEGR